jgi:hypothetical protein
MPMLSEHVFNLRLNIAYLSSPLAVLHLLRFIAMVTDKNICRSPEKFASLHAVEVPFR